jgi:HAD superfamily hydrolase (TIGR01509 family)
VIAAVIFDVDGTLAETEAFHRQAFNLAFAEAGLDWHWDEALYRTLLKVTGGKERILAYIQRLAPDVPAGMDMLVPALHARKTHIYAGYIAGGAIPLRPGIREFIASARGCGYALAIATTTSLENVEALLGSAFGPDWSTLFPVVAAGDMVARKKPAPDIYTLALKKLVLGAQHAIAVEDSRNGVLSAGTAGLRCIAVRSLYTDGDDLSEADVILQDTTDLTLRTLRDLAERKPAAKGLQDGAFTGW